MFSKVQAECPGISKEFSFQISIKDMNEKAGPNGISYFLAFGIHPIMPLPTMSLPE